jgi:hypothetical protein
MPETTSTSDSVKLWRYMSFARFCWLLQNKRLWLARADLLGDPWEIALAGDQLALVISRHPIDALPSRGARRETAIQRSQRIIKMWRRQTFVSCWSASEHESHALWRIYCPSTEGVSIQTTLAKLTDSVGIASVERVNYETPGTRKRTPSQIELVTMKRPMFAYEQEVRVFLFAEENVQGHALGWNPEKYVESIRVHPEADNSFIETVIDTVDHYAPALRDHVAWSEMREPPPF